MNALETLIDTSTREQPSTQVVTESSLVANRYRFLRPLGEGGMGNVYLADDLQLARPVAIKTIRPELSNNAEVRTRIKRECRMHAAIGVHPHIVTLYDTVEENGHIYLVMEYFAGATLAAHLAATLPSSPGMPLPQALDIFRQLLQGLACIHGREIVHRDIKTSNILLQLQADGRYLVKLTDFGIARAETEESGLTRLTALGSQGPGTPAYMAPERIDPGTFGDICPATDLYAAGIILYELLTGGVPFKGSMTEIFSGHLMQPPVLTDLEPTIPAELGAVLRKVLAKKSADRYQDATSLLEALAGIDAGHAMVPLAVAHHEVTLLATDSDHVLNAGVDPTMLDPALSPGKGVPPSLRKWLYLSMVLIVLLAGYLLRTRIFSEPVAPSGPPTEGAAIPATPAPATKQPPAEPVEEKPTTALQAVETVRQQQGAETAPPADRNSSSTTGNRGWQVIEHHSRKIR